MGFHVSPTEGGVWSSGFRFAVGVEDLRCKIKFCSWQVCTPGLGELATGGI